MSEVTFIIPIGTHHTQQAARAIQSIASQTIPSLLLTMIDNEKQGPGKLRNEMLGRVDTPFVSFLDADDWIEPTFVEECLMEWDRIGGNRYIFTDFVDDNKFYHGEIVQTPCLNGANGKPIPSPGSRPYCGGTWHPITTLIPTDWARAVAGFDETIPGFEDTEFYLKLCTTFRCGHHLARPLFHYVSAGDGRAVQFHNSPEYRQVIDTINIKYGGRMGCCGDDGTPVPPVGEKLPGDVMAITLWQGNRHEHSYVSNRTYARSGNGKTMWIDPRDAIARPDLWRVVEQPKAVDDHNPLTLQGLALASMTTVRRKAQIGDPALPVDPFAAPEPPAPQVSVAPNIERVTKLAGAIGNKLSSITDRHSVNIKLEQPPIFIFDDTPYPSYWTIRRLAELSGFEVRTFSEGVFPSSAPLIICTPQPVPNKWLLEQPNAIAWQLEYAGDYKHNLDGFTGQLWASDAKWAADNKARYVLMGSHPELAENRSTSDYQYDLTMLGYMTPRRAIVKGELAAYRWTPDYPGHSSQHVSQALWTTRLMLHVHQHDHAKYCAPQRFALAAAHRMSVMSEHMYDSALLSDAIVEISYEELDKAASKWLDNKGSSWGAMFHEYLCIENNFRKCVEEALK